MRIRNSLLIDSVPEDCTWGELEARIVDCANGGSFERIFFSEDDGSYLNFTRSENIVVGTQNVLEENEEEEMVPVPKRFISAKATAIWSESQGRLLVINAFPSLRKQYLATPFPKHTE